MRSVILLCVSVALLASHVMAHFELVPESMGHKAYEVDSSDEARSQLEAKFGSNVKSDAKERVLEATKIIEGREGCTWSRFTSLLDLLKLNTYPIVPLVKIALAKQFKACNYEALDLPEKDNLDPEERDKLAQFSKRLDLSKAGNPETLAKACLKFFKLDHNLSFKEVRKHKGDKSLAFKEIFFREMNFCFTIDHKLRHYYEFVDQLADPALNLIEKIPLVVARIKLGMACRAFVNNNQKVEEMAFEKVMGNWYKFKNGIKYVVSSGTDDSHWDWD